MSKFLFRKPDGLPRLVFDRIDFPFKTFSLTSLPSRLRGEVGKADPRFEEPLLEGNIDELEVEPVKTPIEELLDLCSREEIGPKVSDDALQKLFLSYLIAEDPHRRLDRREIQPLAHQISLIQHVVENQPKLGRVLVADEVGLGKTIEAALIIEQFLKSNEGAKVLYLTPARLVPGAARELNRLNLDFRVWMDGSALPEDLKPGTLSDRLVVASIHRASMEIYRQSVAEKRWQMVIVDECHHLSAWEPNGTSATQKYLLVQEIIKNLAEPRRLLLLSGTPHQGNIHRFDNLLALLDPNFREQPQSIKGKIIYRLKEDIKNWNNEPLFPSRDVRPTNEVDLGPELQSWFAVIYDAFSPNIEREGRDAETMMRAQTWRQAQAMQWAASSVEAGLAYLVRQGVRADLPYTDPDLAEALGAIRPYRGGGIGEPISTLYSRIRQQVGASAITVVNEDEVEESESSELIGGKIPNMEAFRTALNFGTRLAKGPTSKEKWKYLFKEILSDLGDEKVVLFAQPIETVLAFKNYVESVYGQKCALIVGGQTASERDQQIEHFRHDPEFQFLVSSRAGGEGINLQNSRRLVHLDVPWNPMEMEQRVGRVHRFGSTETIIVNTLVAKDSRESHMYAVAKRKLHLIASTLGGDQRAETIFGRVMALIPPENISRVILKQPYGSLDDEDTDVLYSLIQAGYDSWKSFHDEYSQELKTSIKPGLASWNDLELLALRAFTGAKVAGFTIPKFSREKDKKVVSSKSEVPVYQIGTENLSIGDCAGFVAKNANGQVARSFGLNDQKVIDLSRRIILENAGAGFVRLNNTRRLSKYPDLLKHLKENCVVLAYLCTQVRPNPNAVGGYDEGTTTLRAFLFNSMSGSTPVELKADELGSLIKDAFETQVYPRKPRFPAELVSLAVAAEENLIVNLMREKQEDRSRFSPFPIVALGIVIE